MMRLLPLLLLSALAGCGVTRVVATTADGRPLLVRCPQPDAATLVDLHDRYGVATVLNLRGEKPGRGWFEEERGGVAGIGARWVHLPVSGRRGPTPEQLQSFRRLVEDPSAWPIVMHCQGGIHRTGMLAAYYRIHYQGWNAEAAIAEMEELWFDWTVEDRSAVKAFLRAQDRSAAVR